MKILNEGYRVAYSDKQCDYCKSLIEKNERFYYYQGDVNDDIMLVVLHSKCLDLITRETSFAIKLGDLLLNTSA